jgi:cytosine/adenosine deaminase-related metal-dependent hydrolase
MRGKIENGIGLMNFIRAVGEIRRANVDETKIRYAARYADLLMYQSGVSACMDVSNDSISFNAKEQSKINYHTLVEKYGLLKEQNNASLRDAQWLQQTANTMGLTASITPHAPYSTEENFLATLVSEAAQSGVLSIHHQEMIAEQEWFEDGKGALHTQFAMMGLPLPKPNGAHSLKYLAKHIPRHLRLLLVHNTYMTSEMYDYASEHWDNPHYVLCPCSNMYIERALPPIEMLRSKGAQIALGTDSFASHPSLMMMDDLILLQQYFPDIPLDEIISWATLGGARAMGYDDRLGSIEVGKRPGLVWIENVNLLPTITLTPDSKAQRLV